MKAWRLEYRRRRKAKPKNFEDDPSDWSGIEAVTEQRNNLLKMLWENQVPGSRAPEAFHLEMVQAWSNRGYDVSGAEEILAEGFRALENEDYRQLEVISARLRQALREAPRDKDHFYWDFTNPETWREIREAMPVAGEIDGCSLPGSRLLNKIKYGWLGQIAGGSYGTALEGYTGRTLRDYYGDKLDFYVKEPETYNDDITFQIAFLEAYKEKGEDVTATAIAGKWLEFIPFGWSAEYIALENLRKGIFPPESGSFDNFFSEWIGAQMRGMVCGFVAPGNPLQAAEYAFKDGIVSHEKNGVYGEIHSAVMTSLAFIYDDTREILKKSREYIPDQSQFAYYFDLAIEKAENNSDHLAAWRDIEDDIKKYNWIHTYPNMIAVVYSLWYCENDFRRALRILADCGMDVDCNAGEVGSILGVIKEDGIDNKWFKPFDDTLRTYIPGREEIKISELAGWTYSLQG